MPPSSATWISGVQVLLSIDVTGSSWDATSTTSVRPPRATVRLTSCIGERLMDDLGVTGKHSTVKVQIIRYDTIRYDTIRYTLY